MFEVLFEGTKFFYFQVSAKMNDSFDSDNEWLVKNSGAGDDWNCEVDGRYLDRISEKEAAGCDCKRPKRVA